MGLFLHVVLFPDGEEQKCQSAVKLCAANPYVSVRAEECRWHIYDRGPAVQLNNDCCGYDVLAKNLSLLMPSPVMVLYIYDGDFWGYYLWQNGAETDQFASLADYFEEGQPPQKPGNVQKVAQCFGVPPENIAQYLTPWDEDSVNDSWQMADFMEALGFDYNLLCPPEEETGQPDAPAPKEVSAHPEGPLQQEDIWTNNPLPVDSPILPTALTHRKYALKRANELKEDYPEIIQLIQNKSYQNALPLLIEAIRAEPNRAVLYLLRAFCWKQTEGLVYGMSRGPDMDRDMTKVLELEPDNIMALRARCPTAGTRARCQRHIQDLTRLMELDPENIDLYQVSRAYRWHWSGDDTAARKDLEDVLRRGELWTVDLTYLSKELGMPGF